MNISKYLNLRLGLDVLFFLIIFALSWYLGACYVGKLNSFVDNNTRSISQKFNIESSEKPDIIGQKFIKEKIEAEKKLNKTFLDQVKPLYESMFWIITLLLVLSIFLINNQFLRLFTSMLLLLSFISILRYPIESGISVVYIYLTANNFTPVSGGFWEFCNVDLAFNYLVKIVMIFGVVYYFRDVVLNLILKAYKKFKGRVL